MKLEPTDLTKFDEMIGLLESMSRHKKASSADGSDAFYYEMIANYMRRVRWAKEEGRPIVALGIGVPPEIPLAMDATPMLYDSTALSITTNLKAREDCLSSAKAFGLAPEVCSTHRNLTGAVLKGWLPTPDVVLWISQICDNTAKCGHLMAELFDRPSFFLDRPYRYTEADIKYLAAQLEDMVHFLEEELGRKMDWDRLEETVARSSRLIQLAQEVNELRKTVPSPVANRRSYQMFVIEYYLAGAPEAVTLFEMARDEARERAERGVGFAPEERFRLIALFVPPNHNLKILDWMEREHGGIIVADPYLSHWGEGGLDPSKPLESIARKIFFKPSARQMHAPLEDGLVPDSVNDAMEYGAEGAIYWAHIGCRQGCACIRVVKDALADKVGIPTLVVDIDVTDPTYLSDGELKDKLEGFFEMLEERK